MIEAPCAACGTVNRIAETELPAGAKFVSCTSCKSRIALPTKTIGAAIPPVPVKPPPIPKPSAAPTLDLADLPAPKRSNPLAGAVGDTKPAPKSALSSLDADLPAPKPIKGATGPTPKLKSQDIDADLPAPKPRAPVADLPAPKAAAGLADLPGPKTKTAVGPAVKPATPVIADLPGPKPAVARSGLGDLPAAKPSRSPLAPAAPAADAIIDLPAPLSAGADDLELPAPNAAVGGGLELPAPKGFFDDLPQPAKSQPAVSDVPAPKGFFDDLPQPAKSQPAVSDVPAPKGFFDDLPQPAKSQPVVSDVPAPKGFFDDLPEPTGDAATAQAPKGFFDDLPPPSKPAGGPPAPAVGIELDPGPAGLELDLGSAGGGKLDGPELDLGPAAGPPQIGDKPASTQSSGAFDLDLSEPVKPMMRIDTPPDMKLKTPQKGAPAKPLTPIAPPAAGAPKAEAKLEIEDSVRGAPATVAKAKKVEKAKETAQVDAAAKAKAQKRLRLVLGGVLGLAALGGGGFYFYQRHVKAKERAEKIEEAITTARSALVAGDPSHWTRAASTASSAIELDAENGEALAISAEASLAGALDTGLNAPARLASGRRMISDAIAAGHTGPEIEHAQALAAIASGNADAAIQKLTAAAGREPNNAFVKLYLGWAELAKGDAKAAIDSFTKAADNAAVKQSALYARGQAKLLQADLAGARADFGAVLELNKDHIGAQVGLAEALPPEQASQREQDLLAILARKDIDKADPRVVVRAWSLAADVARLGARLDVARDRYHKAMVIAPTDVTALTGAASVELRDGKVQVATELVQKAIAQAKDDPAANLERAEINIRQGKLPDASATVQQLDARVPPLPPLLHAQLQIVKGKLLEAQGSDLDAVDAYEQGSKDAGDLDLAPTMAAVEKLGALAKKASDNKDDKKAAEYRDRAEKMLASVATRAQEDAQLSMTLGIAYLQAGDAAKAEGLLKRAVDMRPQDIDVKVEHAKALAKLERVDDAVAELKAAAAQDPTRSDIQLELARTYEAAKRDDDAKKAYEALVSAKDVVVPARVHAGRFFARKGEVKKAAEQGDAILLVEPANAAGHYLKGEGLLAQGPSRLDDARKELAFAVDADPEPQYLDAQGRAAEATVAATGEIKFYELALRAYQRATTDDPTLFNAWAGMGRVHVARKEWDQAVKPLQEANKLNPEDADVCFNLGLTAMKLAQKESAIAWFVKAKLKKPSAETAHLLAQLYVDVNRPRYVAEALEESTRLGAEQEKQGKAPEWLTEEYFALGERAYTDGNHVVAKKAWTTFLSRNPKPSVRVDEAKQHLGTDLR